MQSVESTTLMGDFNARTGEKSDLVIFLNQIPPKERKNEDKKLNTNGHLLLELFKSTDMIIINNKAWYDKHIGRYTCNTHNGSSVIDYAICHSGIHDYVTDFEVLDFEPALSDVHSPITFSLSLAKSTEPRKIQETVSIVSKIWNQNTLESYLKNLMMRDLGKFSTKQVM